MILVGLLVTAALSAPGADADIAAPPGAPLSFLAEDQPAHLSLSLRAQRLDELKALVQAQQDPRSPDFRRYLTPAELGERFGLAPVRYQQVLDWLTGAGFAVQTFPNRLFVEGTGTVRQVQQLLGVIPVAAPTRHSAFARSFIGVPRVPEAITSDLLEIGGLDTRSSYGRAHYRLGNGSTGFGPIDLRNFYDSQSIEPSTSSDGGPELAILGCAVDSTDPLPVAPVNDYLTRLASSGAVFEVTTLPNPNHDTEAGPVIPGEFELDAEMQATGCPGASRITAVLSPCAETMTTGANYIVNSLPNATAVSTSFGACELGIKDNPQSVEQIILQGTAEGQTWFAAQGDMGSDDCAQAPDFDLNTQAFAGQVAVDFPGTIPEMVSVGGTETTDAPQWQPNGTLLAYQAEQVWWTTAYESASGGGVSTLFAKPAWQLGVTPDDSKRDVPDLALMAANLPGIVSEQGTVGTLGLFAGTSASAPLAAGFFALLSSQLGCRLGDIHATLYSLGARQLDAGGSVFHDITVGNNSIDGVAGYSAGPGFDLASGWGSLDVAQLAAAWPPCPSGSTTGGSTAGTTGTTGGGGSSTGSSTGSSSGGSTAASPSSSGSSSGGATGSSGSGGLSSTGGSPSAKSGCATGGFGAPSALAQLLWLALCRRRRAGRSQGASAARGHDGLLLNHQHRGSTRRLGAVAYPLRHHDPFERPQDERRSALDLDLE